jgi:hypothetical protein
MRRLGARAPQIRQSLMDRDSVILILDPVQRCLVEIDGMSCAAEAGNCASAVVNVPLPQRRSHQDWGRAHSIKGVRIRAVASLTFISPLYF